jgi:prophage tail gpP-like protein
VPRLIDSPNHDVSIVVDGREVRGWSTWELTESMFDPAAQFTFRLPWSRDAWDHVKPDRVVKVIIDGTQRLVGFLDDREVPEDEDTVIVTGRNLVGRLVNESAPTVNYRDLGHLDLIAKVAAPWFTKVTASNERNRNVTRGKGKRVKARPIGQALTLSGKKKTGTRIEPGQTRWAVIEQLCEQSGVLCWAAGDGRELVVGRPHYEQETQFRFFMPAPGSTRTRESTVLAMGVKESTAELYSRVICVGSGQGTDANYGSAVAARSGEARENFDDPEGVGGRFTAPKRLVIQRAVRSVQEAQDLAWQEMFRREVQSDIITVKAPGLGQRIAGAYTTLFGFDMLASCEHEATGKSGTYLITGCTMRGSREGAEETSMQLVPKGVELTIR